ncbi:MAG TPA: SDR family NAD(P)-dependent oxidoreductase, partial [Acetobacteraceae bacterium]|nr:SDR family NAD(P)-dependent oxidoreductase [Acetobacteraceae bacterium]
MFQPGLFKGHRILVTGGGTGLGRAMAERLLELGAEIVICGRRGRVLDAAAAEMTARHGGGVSTHVVDIRDAAAVDAMIETIWKGGKLTGLINNAAGNFVSRTQDLSPRGFD